MSEQNQFKLALAKLFAECEDKGLGTWQPTFQATEGMNDAAANYIEARMVFVAENEFGKGEVTH